MSSILYRMMRIAERVAARRLAVFDFDDTLVTSESSVTVEHGDGEVTVMDSAAFAYFKGTDGDRIDFADFNNVSNPRLIRSGMEAFKKAAGDPDTRTVILTARPKGSASALKKFMEALGFENIEAVALQSSDPMDKARWIEQQAGNVEEVEFMDDSSKNVEAVESLKGKINVKTVNPPHPKEGDYEGNVIKKTFESDTPTPAKVEVKQEQDPKTPHSNSPWWTKQSPEFQRQYCKEHPESPYCGARAARTR